MILFNGDLAYGLECVGCKVLHVNSAEAALSHLRNGHRIDLVITDIDLGGALNGWDLAESFRNAHPKIPVIYVSGNPFQPGRQVQDSVLVRKPFALADILKAIPPA